MPGLLDRQIARMFVGYFLAGLAVFVILFLAIDFLTLMVKYSETPLGLVFKYYLFFTPEIIHQMLPIAALMGTVFTISSLNRSGELVAMYSIGMSLARISTPILVIVAIVSAVSLWMSDRILPSFTQKKNYTYQAKIRNRPGLFSTVNKNKIWYRSENSLFNIKSLNVKNRAAQGLTLYYFDSTWDLIQVIQAESVTFSGKQWNLNLGQVTLFEGPSSFPLTESFTQKMILMNEDFSDIETTNNSSELMSLKELSRFIEKNQEAGLETTPYEVDYHSKFGFALAALVMSLMGIPFSVAQRRTGGAMVNVGICIGLAFLYWIGFSSMVTLGRHGALSPVISAWSANIFMFLGSLIRLNQIGK